MSRSSYSSKPHSHNVGGRALALIALSAASLTLVALVGCHKKPPPETGPLPISYKPLPKLTPVPMSPATVDAFVNWMSVMPSSQAEEARGEIDKVAKDSSVLTAVASRLSFQKPGSYGRQLLYLTILGQMRNAAAVAPLSSYLNSPDCLVFEQLKRTGRVVAKSSTTYFDACAGLKSAAVNMLSFINSETANAAVLAAVQNHPSRAVRLSAVDAYLYNHNDSREALDQLRPLLKPDEQKLLGLPRLDAQGSRKALDERVARFYEEHPEEHARVPGRLPPADKAVQQRHTSTTAGPSAASHPN